MQCPATRKSPASSWCSVASRRPAAPRPKRSPMPPPADSPGSLRAIRRHVAGGPEDGGAGFVCGQWSGRSLTAVPFLAASTACRGRRDGLPVAVGGRLRSRRGTAPVLENQPVAGPKVSGDRGRIEQWARRSCRWTESSRRFSSSGDKRSCWIGIWRPSTARRVIWAYRAKKTRSRGERSRGAAARPSR